MSDDLFDSKQLEDEQVVKDFFNLLPLIYTVLFDEPDVESLISAFGPRASGLGEGDRRALWINRLLDLKKQGKELNINTLRLLDPKGRSPHVKRLIKKRKKEK
jgi:hypothetical protein